MKRDKFEWHCYAIGLFEVVKDCLIDDFDHLGVFSLTHIDLPMMSPYIQIAKFTFALSSVIE